MSLPEQSPSPDSQQSLGLIRELFEDAKAEKRKVIPTWNRWYRLTRNKMWSENRASWLPSPSSSEIFPTIATLVAWMTDQQPRMFTSPAPMLEEFSQPPDEQLVSKKAQQMQQTLDSWWETTGVAAQMQMCLWDMFTFGCGIFKTGWDPTLRDGEGDAVLRRMDPYAGLPDPEASSVDDLRYFIEARRVPMFEIARRFPERAHMVRPDQRPPSDTERRPRPSAGGFETVAMGQLGATGVTGGFPGTPTQGIPPLWGPPGHHDDDYTKTVLLKECWIRGTHRLTIPVIEDGERVDDMEIDAPYWQLLCEAGGVILNEDTTNPFDHGQLPYTRLPHVETGEFWSVSLIEHLAPGQIALNRLLAALQINAELVGNPILLEDNDAGISRTKIINRPGGRLTKNVGKQVEWLNPPQMPPLLMQLVDFWRNTIDRVSGISAVARGANLRRREPAAAVDAVQEASFVRVRAVIRNMEESLRIGGQQVAANIVQNYIEPRTIPLVGLSGSENYLQLGQKPFYYPEPDPVTQTVNDIPLKFDVWIQAGSSLPISRQARSAEADALFHMGALDIEGVLAAHDWPDREQVIKRLQSQPQPEGTDPRKRPGGR